MNGNDISKKDIETNIAYYEKRIKALEKLLETYRQSLNLMIYYKKSLKAEKIKFLEERIEWREIILGVLNSREELLTTKEIFTIAIKNYPELNGPDRKLLLDQVSNALTGLSITGKVGKFRLNGYQGNFWGLSKLFILLPNIDPNPIPRWEYAKRLKIKGVAIPFSEEMYISKDYYREDNDN